MTSLEVILAVAGVGPARRDRLPRSGPLMTRQMLLVVAHEWPGGEPEPPASKLDGVHASQCWVRRIGGSHPLAFAEEVFDPGPASVGASDRS